MALLIDQLLSGHRQGVKEGRHRRLAVTPSALVGAASFALLVYVSAWLKCHYPAAFAAALLNSQPMGFYAPAQIVGDARAHGVDVCPVDVNHSAWDCTLEPAGNGRMPLRLGFRLVDGLGKEMAARLIAARASGYPSVASLSRRAG